MDSVFYAVICLVSLNGLYICHSYIPKTLWFELFTDRVVEVQHRQLVSL